MRRGELDFVGAGPEEGAGGLAHAWRDARGLAARQVKGVNLKERIPWLALALKNEAPAIGRPITFARPASFNSEAPDPRQEVLLLVGRGLLRQQGRHTCA